jgi:hypothetical protein
MKLRNWSAGLMGAGLLGMLLGTSGMARAQEGRDEAKPPQQEEPKQEEAKPERQKDAKPDAKPGRQQNDEAKPGRQQESGRAEEGKSPKNEKENPEMRTGQEQQGRPAEKNGGDHAARASGQRGQKIPDDKFRSNFGRQHTFRVQKPVVVEGQPRFQYGGYWFVIADPWPVGWDYSAEVYVDYIDGEYVLIDLLHPGVQIAVFVVE